MKKFITAVVLAVIGAMLYVVYSFLNSPHNWHDWGINTFPENHTINYWQGVLEIVPWDIMIDIGGTVAACLAVLYVLVVGGKNFITGLRGDPRIYYSTEEDDKKDRD